MIKRSFADLFASRAFLRCRLPPLKLEIWVTKNLLAHPCAAQPRTSRVCPEAFRRRCAVPAAPVRFWNPCLFPPANSSGTSPIVPTDEPCTIGLITHTILRLPRPSHPEFFSSSTAITCFVPTAGCSAAPPVCAATSPILPANTVCCVCPC